MVDAFKEIESDLHLSPGGCAATPSPLPSLGEGRESGGEGRAAAQGSVAGAVQDDVAPVDDRADSSVKRGGLMMNRVHLDPGIYLNVFPVKLPEDTLPIMTAPRTLFQDLRPLRQRLDKAGTDAWVYADGNLVYGYGPDAASLEAEGFREASLRLVEAPRLATRVIVEGLVNALTAEGYEALPRKGRWQVYHPGQSTEVAGGRIRVHRGYDLRASFWRDIVADQLAFGLIVDIIWALRDNANQPLNMRQIRQQYGYRATIAIGQVQGEYLPHSSRLNTEVARQRFQKHILPFVQNHSEFDLPCGGRARLFPEPIRVILGGEER